MDEQIYIALEKTRNHEENDRMVRLVMCKKDIGDDIVAMVAVGYEGGGQWSEYYAVYKLDEYQESVEDTIEYSIGMPDYDSKYQSEYDDILQYINKFCDFDEEFIPFLKEEYLNEDEFDNESETYDKDWNWDDETHLIASSDWQIFYKW